MPMPNRNVEGGYRYGYQGEYAEKEPELEGSVNSFQLRLWDARIGRWLTIDPAGQHFSPYMGMGNNPISRVDPDGGCDDPPCDPPIATVHLDEVVITATSNASGISSGSWQRYVPVWGSGVDAYDAFSRGDTWTGIGHSLLAISDVFLVKSLVVGAGKFTVRQFAKQAAKESTEQLLLSAPKTVKHHIFNVFRGSSPKSQVYRDFFKKHGIKLDDHVIVIAEGTHKKVHAAGKNWTTIWKKWINANPNATTKDVYQQAGKMLDDFGLNHVPITTYK